MLHLQGKRAQQHLQVLPNQVSPDLLSSHLRIDFQFKFEEHMKNLTKIHLVTMDTNTAKEECTCSMHYALLLYVQTKKKQYDQN